ncbi:MAG: hypothetical protein A2632_00975 [Candidatus Pacebacteria bacterium RIFCSPHIGHO2_01_FULL_46_16]|nr:MAG: hypothetical protein A2632_00975 [Candidatus Pacebacteria bacterium RIFCSPHIGHO2_01_FULL_46_16]OGJ20061.1 MAG: hypothetical protein A3J60_00830 [Candidatus Pacebacteria bacterium RIFCSPHIGHO2_02_FULL_46_9]
MKKLLFALIAIVILIVAAVLFWRLRPASQSEPAPAEKKRIVQPVNIIPQEERPYLSISPEADGKNILITVHTLKNTATEVEYELEYQAGTLLQGAFGALSLATLPASEKILLGSCSAGGACTYHADVKGGTLTTNFIGQTDYSLKTEWKFIDNKAKETSFSSKDGKFQLKAIALAKVRYLVLSQASGIPDGYPGKLVSEPYSLELSAPTTGEAEISIRATSEDVLTILGWNGSAWKSFPTTQADKVASATVSLLPLYVVVVQ